MDYTLGAILHLFSSSDGLTFPGTENERSRPAPRQASDIWRHVRARRRHMDIIRMAMGNAMSRREWVISEHTRQLRERVSLSFRRKCDAVDYSL